MIQELARAIGHTFAVADFTRQHPREAVNLAARKAGEELLQSPLNPFGCYFYAEGAAKGGNIYRGKVSLEDQIPKDAIAKKHIPEGTPLNPPGTIVHVCEIREAEIYIAVAMPRSDDDKLPPIAVNVAGRRIATK